ncbi:cubilin-like [Haliotis rufescens]|uniref:cubilin-like n=1 Tax=Haliotis rufescens TaxID=6454 RepID=UPI00201F6EF9|nr:cubilin-like [Haliotis rufescens]
MHTFSCTISSLIRENITLSVTSHKDVTTELWFFNWGTLGSTLSSDEQTGYTMLILTLISTLSLMSNIYAEFNNTAGAVFNTTLLINETATHVVSPVFTHLYDRIDFSAWWNLKADRPDMNIVFAIRRLGMHFPSHCAYNSLTVYDGPGTTSPRLAAVCQSLSDKHLISSGDTMFIDTHFEYFRNDEIYAFDFSSEKVNKSCGGILVANSTTNELISPGFPRSYFNLETCEWIIQSLNMSDTILIDVRSVRLQQSSDILKIFLQNDTYNEQLIKNICSNMTHTFQVQSPRNTISLRFETDNELVGEGFRLTYRAVPESVSKMKVEVFAGELESPSFIFIIIIIIIIIISFLQLCQIQR